MKPPVTVSQLKMIAEMADEFEEWMSNNTGTTADWPVELKVDSQETADHLAALLTKLAWALVPYRKAKK